MARQWAFCPIPSLPWGERGGGGGGKCKEGRSLFPDHSLPFAPEMPPKQADVTVRPWGKGKRLRGAIIRQVTVTLLQ